MPMPATASALPGSEEALEPSGRLVVQALVGETVGLVERRTDRVLSHRPLRIDEPVAHHRVAGEALQIGLEEGLVLRPNRQPEHGLAHRLERGLSDRRVAGQFSQQYDAFAPGLLVVGQHAGIGELGAGGRIAALGQRLEADSRLFPAGARPGQRLVILDRQVEGRRAAAKGALIGSDRAIVGARRGQPAGLGQGHLVGLTDRHRAFQFGRPGIAGIDLAQPLDRGPHLVEALALQFDGAELEQRLGIVGLALEDLAQRLRGEVGAIALAPHRRLLEQQAIDRRRGRGIGRGGRRGRHFGRGQNDDHAGENALQGASSLGSVSPRHKPPDSNGFCWWIG